MFRNPRLRSIIDYNVDSYLFFYIYVWTEIL